MKTKKHINRPMNKATKLLRDRAMNVINEAKYDRGYRDLPFIRVKITDATQPKILGSGGSQHIWITERALQRQDYVAIVLHELCHAVFKTKHNKRCPLMRPTASDPISDEVAWERFEHYADKYFG
tara:strand:+ start:805 stop:1179 length:375 start_codon:yes stop_codon:yes gene_type:complete